METGGQQRVWEENLPERFRVNDERCGAPVLKYREGELCLEF